MSETNRDLQMGYVVRLDAETASRLAHRGALEGDVLQCHFGDEAREGDVVLVHRYDRPRSDPDATYRAIVGELGCVTMGDGDTRRIVGWTVGPLRDRCLHILSDGWEVMAPARQLVRGPAGEPGQMFRPAPGEGPVFPGNRSKD